jgi:hypothetical protein
LTVSRAGTASSAAPWRIAASITRVTAVVRTTRARRRARRLDLVRQRRGPAATESWRRSPPATAARAARDARRFHAGRQHGSTASTRSLAASAATARASSVRRTAARTPWQGVPETLAAPGRLTIAATLMNAR